MDGQLDLAQAFIDRCRQGAPLAELVTAFRRTLQQLGFGYFACCSHVDPLWPPPWAVMILHYPERWVRYFSDRQFYQNDPVFQRADRADEPFFWYDRTFLASLTPLQHDILAEARRLGLENGYTVPILVSDGVRASCSVVPDGPSVDPHSYLIVGTLARGMFAAARQVAVQRHPLFSSVQLSERERQCLKLVAHGMTDAMIAKRLNLAPSTVHNHLANIMECLGATKRIQALMLALATENISLSEILRQEISVVSHRPVKGK